MEKIKEAQLVEDPNAMAQPVQATPEEVVEAQPQAPLAEPPVAEAPVEAPVAEAPVEAPIEASEEQPIEEPVDVAPELPNTPAEEQGEGIFKAPMEGMVPSGWVFPDELAQAVAMVTGDVEASATAPDATIAPTSPELAPQEEPQRESVEEKEEPLEEKVEDLDDKLDALIDKMRKADANGNKDEVEDCKKRMIKLLGMAMKEGKIDNLINDFATDPSEAHPEDREDLDDVLAEFGYDDEKEAIEQAHPELKEGCECEEKCEEDCEGEGCDEYYNYCEISGSVYSVTCDSSCPFECNTGIGGADDAPFRKGLLFIDDEDGVCCKEYKDALEKGVEKFPQEIDVFSDETIQKVIEILEKHGFNDHEELPMSKLYPMGANEGMTSILFELPMVPTEEEMENIKGMFDELCALKADDSLEESVEEETSEEEASEEEVAEELPQEEAPVEEIGAEEVAEDPIADLEEPMESEITSDEEEEVAEEEPSEEVAEETAEVVEDAVEELKDELEDAEEPSEILDATTEFLKKIFGEFEKEEGEVEETPNLDVMEDPMIDPTFEEEPSEEVAEEEPAEDIVEEPSEEEVVEEPLEDLEEPSEEEEEEEEEDEIFEACDKFANPRKRFAKKGEKEEKVEESCEVTSDNVWDVYDSCLEHLGAEELLLSLLKALSTDDIEDLFRYIKRVYEIEEKLPIRADKDKYMEWADNVVAVELGGEYDSFCEWLARAMGAWKLADNLEYICRCWDLPCCEEEEEEYEEACKMKEEIFVPAGSKLKDDKEEKREKVAQMAEKADARRKASKKVEEAESKAKFKEALNTSVKSEVEELAEDSWEARRIEESKSGRFSWSEFKKKRY